MDYRKNRKEAFINWFGWSLTLEDCDPALFMTNYFFDRFEYNTEQRLWIIWLYGTTYYWPTAYVIWNEFPDMALVDLDKLTEWNNKNYSRLRYQTDTKWNKGHLLTQFKSYRDWIGNRTQEEALRSHTSRNQVTNFENLWKVANSWHKFGRYTAWFYLQTIHNCTDINVEATSLMLHDHSGSRSHRNGLCYALGKDKWVDEKLSNYCIEVLNIEAREILQEVKRRFPDTKADYFAMETALCSFKKLFRTSRGRYLGYYLDRQAEEIKKVEKDGWSGIDWQPMWDARKELLNPMYLTNRVCKTKMSIFMYNGVIDYNNTFTDVKQGLGRFM